MNFVFWFQTQIHSQPYRKNWNERKARQWALVHVLFLIKKNSWIHNDFSKITKYFIGSTVIHVLLLETHRKNPCQTNAFCCCQWVINSPVFAPIVKVSNSKTNRNCLHFFIKSSSLGRWLYLLNKKQIHSHSTEYLQMIIHWSSEPIDWNWLSDKTRTLVWRFVLVFGWGNVVSCVHACLTVALCVCLHSKRTHSHPNTQPFSRSLCLCMCGMLCVYLWVVVFTACFVYIFFTQMFFEAKTVLLVYIIHSIICVVCVFLLLLFFRLFRFIISSQK